MSNRSRQVAMEHNVLQIGERMGKNLNLTNMEIKITTGTYNTSDYRVVKEYKSEKAALKFLKTIGYAYDELSNDTWNFYGTKYTLSIQR
jgi:hypothetical protein